MRACILLMKTGRADCGGPSENRDETEGGEMRQQPKEHSDAPVRMRMMIKSM
jgi:hypothetical protein